MMPDRFHDRGARGPSLGQHLREHRRLHDLQPDHQAHRHQDQAGQERHPPAPGIERIGRQRRGQQRHSARAEDQPDGHTDLGETGEQSSFVLVTPFHREKHRAAPLSADRDPLEQAERYEDDRRGYADGRGPGQDADDRRRDAHYQQRDDQRGLAADPVAPVPEDRRPDRPRGEPYE